MRRPQRLRHRQDFAAVYRSGTAYQGRLLVLRVRANPTTTVPRFGFAVGRRLGHAPARNRLKRRLRESARLSGAEGKADVVVIARRQAMEAPFQALDQSLRGLLARAGLLNGEAAE